MSAEEFLKLLRDGGAITSSDEHSPEDIQIAMAEDRFFVDADGNGYIWDSFE
jgi:hypothetical protein